MNYIEIRYKVSFLYKNLIYLGQPLDGKDYSRIELNKIGELKCLILLNTFSEKYDIDAIKGLYSLLSSLESDAIEPPPISHSDSESSSSSGSGSTGPGSTGSVEIAYPSSERLSPKPSSLSTISEGSESSSSSGSSSSTGSESAEEAETLPAEAPAPVAPETGTVVPETGTVVPETGTVAPETGTVAPETGTVAPESAEAAARAGAPETGTVASGAAAASGAGAPVAGEFGIVEVPSNTDSLPPGWKVYRDKLKRKNFYHNSDLNVSTYSMPKKPTVEDTTHDEGLPNGWRKYTIDDTIPGYSKYIGRVYYINDSIGVSSWDKPRLVPPDHPIIPEKSPDYHTPDSMLTSKAKALSRFMAGKNRKHSDVDVASALAAVTAPASASAAAAAAGVGKGTLKDLFDRKIFEKIEVPTGGYEGLFAMDSENFDEIANPVGDNDYLPNYMNIHDEELQDLMKKWETVYSKYLQYYESLEKRKSNRGEKQETFSPMIIKDLWDELVTILVIIEKYIMKVLPEYKYENPALGMYKGKEQGMLLKLHNKLLKIYNEYKKYRLSQLYLETFKILNDFLNYFEKRRSAVPESAAAAAASSSIEMPQITSGPRILKKGQQTAQVPVPESAAAPPPPRQNDDDSDDDGDDYEADPKGETSGAKMIGKKRKSTRRKYQRKSSTKHRQSKKHRKSTQSRRRSSS